MKTFLLTLVICCVSISYSYSCRCVTHIEFNRTLDQNNQIFVGKVISEITVADTVKFYFDVIKKWKGKMDVKSSVAIGTSTGSCGVDFELGETYVVYAQNGYTNICRRSKKLSETFDDRLLDHYFYGKEIGKQLDLSDQKVLKNRVNLEPGNDEKVSLVYDYRALSPKEIYNMHPMQFKAGKYQIIELSPEEKSASGGCIDRVVVMGYVIPKKGWNTKKVVKALKRAKPCSS